MYPVVFETGPILISMLSGAILLALGVIVWQAHRHDGAAAIRWLDVGLAAVLAGVVGARLLYVALEWDHFAQHTGAIVRLRTGGMAWHGALIAGLPAAWITARLRGVAWRPWTDAAALGWPLGVAGAWLACRGAGCAYGYEVRSLADWPAWMVEELPDVYDLPAPRLDLQAGGTIFGLGLLTVVLVMTWRGWLPGLRLWAVLALTGLGMALLGFFRADPAHTVYNRRIDQILDLALLMASTLAGSTLWLLDRRAAARTRQPRKDERHERDAGPGPDRSQAG
jgi:phosphatidylglycerol:prolipoprotein diacylglycerol transferase